jgi:hypothetical protein
MASRKQEALISELDEICAVTGIDYWDIDDYGSTGRAIRLDIMKRKIVVGFVVHRYTLIDEMLNIALCDHFFGRQRSHPQLWRRRKFQDFNFYVLEQLYLLQKLAYVKAFLKVPKNVSRDIHDVNALRNSLAHALFPENLRRYKPRFKGLDIFSLDGIKRFAAETYEASGFFYKRLRLRQRGYVI